MIRRLVSLAFASLMVACAGTADPLGMDEGTTGLGTGGGSAMPGELPAGAGGGSAVGAPPAGELEPSGHPFQEFFDLGFTRYAGTSAVVPSRVTNSWYAPKVDVHRYDADAEERGPICMRGEEFFVESEDGPSDELFIYLQGGGVCVEEICLATTSPLSLRLIRAGDVLGIGGVLDRSDDRNPLRDHDLVYVPYCDGSMFIGDVDRPLPDGNSLDGSDDPAYQRGLLNLTAALEVAKSRYPAPSRIVLLGTSGGAYGTLPGVVLTRFYYPDTPLVVVSDSGAPVASEEDPTFASRAMTELNALYLPESCEDCLDDGHLTGLVEWALDRDESLRLAYMSHTKDAVIGEIFLGQAAESHETAQVRETGELMDAFPGRVNRFVLPGNRHTFVIDANTGGSLQGVFAALFGNVLVTSGEVSTEAFSGLELGSLAEEGVDEEGYTVSGYAWLTAFLAGADVPNVLNR